MRRRRLLRLSGGALATSSGIVINAPTDIANLNVWFDASGLATNTSNAYGIVSAGNAVSRWSDLSGNNNHLTQATGANQPSLLASAQNSKNGVKFVTATQQFFTLTNALNFTSTDGHTSFSVCCRADVSTTEGLMGLVGAQTVSPSSDYTLRYGPAGSTNFITASASDTFTASGYAGDTAFHALGSQASGASGTLWKDNVSISPNHTTSTRQTVLNTMGRVNNGASYIYGSMTICEHIDYARVLSAAEINAVFVYLKAKWATP